MNLYENFAGALIIIVAVALPGFVALRAAYRQHSRWLILPYATVTAFFGTYLQGLAPRSHDPQSLNFGDGFTFLVGLVLFGGGGGVVYLVVRAAGKFKNHTPSLREQAAHLAAFIGLLGLGIALIFAFGFSPFL
ncbi:MAG TPA: hypothetical protein EYG79_08365 [Rhodobacteraceae bacterium]|nr:hypothetical protein [Paracoccaceae bacterium]